MIFSMQFPPQQRDKEGEISTQTMDGEIESNCKRQRAQFNNGKKKQKGCNDFTAAQQ
jgi:hypothetical protein